MKPASERALLPHFFPTCAAVAAWVLSAANPSFANTVTYTGTNIYTDARLGGVYRINATNDFRLHKPTGATDGQSLKWHIKQHAGGTNTITLVAAEFIAPVGSVMPVLSVTNGCVDTLAGEWDSSVSKVRLQSFLRYTQ